MTISTGDSTRSKMPEIPLAACPHCAGTFLAIKSVTPKLIGRGVNVEYVCAKCEAVVVTRIG